MANESKIDLILTEAVLRDVKTCEFSVMLDGIGIDIDNHRKMLKRYDLKEDKTLGAMLVKEEQLNQLSREWCKAVGLNEYRQHRIVILIEEIKD